MTNDDQIRELQNEVDRLHAMVASLGVMIGNVNELLHLQGVINQAFEQRLSETERRILQTGFAKWQRDDAIDHDN
jgi:hypothetical protein